MLDENLVFVQGRTYFSAGSPVFRRALTIFLCEVHIAVCGCVPYNRKADFDIAIRLFRLGARLLAQYVSNRMRMVGCRRTVAWKVVVVKTKS